MMREIRFRAWWKDTLEPVPDFMEQYSLDVLDGANDNPFIYSQSTGLKDRNGKEVWEGDILSREYFSNWVVVWGTAAFHIYNVCDPNKTYPLVQTFDREVIGNIYSNPEPFPAPDEDEPILL